MGLIAKPAWSGRYLPFGATGFTVAPVAMRNGQVINVRRGMRGFGDASAPTNVYVQTAAPANPTVSNCPYDCTTFFNWAFHPCCVNASPNWEGNLVAGGNPYQGLPAPPPPSTVPAPVPTPANPTPLTTPPVDQSGAQDTVDQTIIAGQQQQQQQAQGFFTDLNTAIQNAAGGTGCSSMLLPGVCDSTIFLAGGVIGVLFLLYSMGGRR